MLRPSPPPAATIIVNRMRLISVVLNIMSALVVTLMLRWTRTHPAVSSSEGAKDHVPSRSFLVLGTLTYDMDHAVATTIVFLHLSMLLFLVSLVIFFFTIHKIAAIVVSIAVGVTVNYTRFLDEVNDWRTYLALL